MSNYEGTFTYSSFGIISHELGHALFKLRDFYSEKGRLTAGEIYGWGLMGSGNLAKPPAPIFCQNKIKLGWLQESKEIINQNKI